MILQTCSFLELLSPLSSLFFFSFIQWLIFKCLLRVRYYSWCWVHSSQQTGKVQVLIHWCFTGEGQTINILRSKTNIIWEEQVRISRERVTRWGSTVQRKVREGLMETGWHEGAGHVGDWAKERIICTRDLCSRNRQEASVAEGESESQK